MLLTWAVKSLGGPVQRSFRRSTFQYAHRQHLPAEVSMSSASGYSLCCHRRRGCFLVSVSWWGLPAGLRSRRPTKSRAAAPSRMNSARSAVPVRGGCRSLAGRRLKPDVLAANTAAGFASHRPGLGPPHHRRVRPDRGDPRPRLTCSALPRRPEDPRRPRPPPRQTARHHAPDPIASNTSDHNRTTETTDISRE